MPISTFPRMPLPDTKGKQVSPYFQAVIVISLKPLNHFLCHIIAKASVSFKTKCRTASVDVSDNSVIFRKTGNPTTTSVAAGAGMKTSESREASEVSPSLLLHSLFMWQLWSVFLSECVQWRTPPEFAPSSFVQFIASGPQRHANDIEVWGNWARRHWEAAGRRLLRCFFALPFITHLPLDMVRRHRVCFSSILNPLSLYK